MKILFINACIREKESRTLNLANYFINNLKEKEKNIEINELLLAEEKELKPILKEELAFRNELIKQKEYNHDIFKYAQEFSKADKVIIAAPCWDYSFPSILKVYIENICVLGLTFKYNVSGDTSTGLSKFSSLLYITTVGGIPHDKEYMKNITAFLGKGNYFEVCATGLDIIGNDVNKILNKAKNKLDKLIELF